MLPQIDKINESLKWLDKYKSEIFEENRDQDYKIVSSSLLNILNCLQQIRDDTNHYESVPLLYMDNLISYLHALPNTSVVQIVFSKR